MTKRTFRRAFRDSLPIMAGYLALGFGFGVLLQSKGYSFWWAILMSCTMFAGSGQYAGVDFLASGATILTTAVMTLIINARHFFYGFSLLDKYKGMGVFKPYLIFGLTDETYSIVCSAQLDETISKRKYFVFLTALNHFYWIAGSTIGAVIGGVLPFSYEGVDFAMTALFLVILTDQCRERQNRIPAMIGAFSAVAACLVFGVSKMFIPAMTLIVVTFLLTRRWLDADPEGRADE